MSKQHNAGAISQAARIEALEKGQAELYKRIDALLVIVEKQNEQLNKLVDERVTDTYQPVFDRWPSDPR